MGEKKLPKYPVYIPSKGRHATCLTAEFLIRDSVPFQLVVEPQEAASYAERYGENNITVLPFRDRGSVIPARNWILEHSKELGYKRHWQLDDNIRSVFRWYKGKRVGCMAGPAMAAMEDFVDRYENVALAGPNYDFFAIARSLPPFYLNVHVYSFTLTLNEIPYRWRGRYNEDTDICLQALSGGWCTVLFNIFLQKKMRTMQMKGGNTDKLYKADGRLMMARSLERKWPGVVKTSRRFGRPQHIVFDAWRRFDTPLKRREDIDWDALEDKGVDEYGMELKQIDDVESEHLKEVYRQWHEEHANQDNEEAPSDAIDA